MTDIAEKPQDGPVRRPPQRVLPDWRTDLANLRYWLRYTLLFHLANLHKYWARLAFVRSWFGIGRTIRTLYRWVMDAPGTTMRTSIAHNTGKDAADGKVFVELTKQHRQTVSGRVFVILLVLAGLAFLAYTTLHGFWPIVAVTAAALTLFGLLGLDRDHPVVDTPEGNTDQPKLTPDLIRVALDSLPGIPGLKGDAVTFITPVARVKNIGYQVALDVPHGVTAGVVVAKRSALASGLRRPLACVWPSGDPKAHEGRLVLYVADHALSNDKPLPWPLTKSGRTDIFTAVPVGVDTRGETVDLRLIFTNLVVGGLPRGGKTFSVQLILLAAALDPSVRLWVFNLKGGGDLVALEPICHAFRVGDSDEDIAYLLAKVKTVQEDMRRRYDTIEKLTRARDPRCPENKVTRELCDDPTLDLAPTVLAFDEVQVALMHPFYGKEISAILADISRRGPACGVVLIVSTQQPSTDTLPYAISVNAGRRIAFRVMRHNENDAILGSGSYSSGITATSFTEDDVGIALMTGGSVPTVTKFYYVDAPTAELIAKRARTVRQGLGLLTGHAAGQDEEIQDADEDPTLSDLVSVWPANRPHVWLEELAERLRVRYPARHEGCTKDWIREAVAPYGIRTKKVRGQDSDGEWRTRAGITWEDLQEALRGREETPEDGCEPQDAA